MERITDENIFSFKCGEMNVENGKVKPNSAQGYIKIYLNPDNLLVWEWYNASDESQSSEPFVIFPNDCEWKRIKTSKGRVYQLISQQFETSYYYWLQEPELEKDEELETKIKQILQTGSLSGKQKEQDLSLKEESIPEVSKNDNKNAQNIMDQISNALKNVNCKYLK